MTPNQQTRYNTTKRLTIISASTNTLLAVLKVIVGYLCHSQALIADGLHSFSDLLNDALILLATRMGGRIPDKEHPYGHQRFETIATISLAFLMLLVGCSIFYENLAHLITAQKPVIHSLPVLITAIISILAYEGLHRYNRKIGERIHSNLLISNASHNRSDALTSAIVMFTAIGAWLHIPHLDAVGALFIAIFITKMGITIFWHGLQELIDAGADEATLDRIITCIQAIAGVSSVHQLRTRMHSGTIFIDVHIIVKPFISVSEGHHIGELIHLKLKQTLPNIADVIVHVDPEDDEKSRPSIHLPSRHELLGQLEQYWQSLPGYKQIKNITIHYLNGYIYLEIVLPLDILINIDVDAAQLTEYYQQVKQHLPSIADITIRFQTTNSGLDNFI